MGDGCCGHESRSHLRAGGVVKSESGGQWVAGDDLCMDCLFNARLDFRHLYRHETSRSLMQCKDYAHHRGHHFGTITDREPPLGAAWS